MPDPVCYDCGGEGFKAVRVHEERDDYGVYAEEYLLRCQTCDGTGTVSAAQRAAWEAGQRVSEKERA